MHNTIEFGIAETEQDLRQILELQQQNLKTRISDETRDEQGFLTINHSFEELLTMQAAAPQIICKDLGKVVAFALAMRPESGKLISDLKPMFVLLDELTWKGKPLHDYRYYVMGQICVGEAYRGKGIFDALYQKHREVYEQDYDLCVTEISTSNKRSQRAHERVGFQTIHQHVDHVDAWNVVVWQF